MKNIIIYPIFGMMLLGIAMQLIDIAESTGAKTIDFADDMEKAMDCAIKGVDLKFCSPGLLSYNFDKEINGTIKASNEIIETFSTFMDSDDVQNSQKVVIHAS